MVKSPRNRFFGGDFILDQSVSVIHIFIDDRFSAFFMENPFFSEAFQDERTGGMKDDVLFFNKRQGIHIGENELVVLVRRASHPSRASLSPAKV